MNPACVAFVDPPGDKGSMVSPEFDVCRRAGCARIRRDHVRAAVERGDIEAVARMGGLRPRGHEVLIERDGFPDKTEGGLYIPERAKEEFSDMATVLGVGSEVKVDVRRGDRVAVDMGKMVRYVKYRNGAVPDSRIGFVDEDLIDARELREGEA